MQMTYRKAIIILDRLVTTGRIEVDREELREELREAVKAAQKALNIVADLPPNHGRLIEADELRKDRIILYGTTDVVLMVDIENAPTIIKAEVSEE